MSSETRDHTYTCTDTHTHMHSTHFGTVNYHRVLSSVESKDSVFEYVDKGKREKDEEI